MTTRRRLIVASIALALIAVWALVAFWVGPGQISRAHRSESWPVLNNLLVGRGHIPLEEYLANWRRFAIRFGWGLAGALALGYTALELLSSDPGRRFRQTIRNRLEQARHETLRRTAPRPRGVTW